MNPNWYVNDELGFSIRKPESWAFLPTAWALKLRSNLDFSSEELQRVFEQAATPFVCAHLPHGDPTSALPTLQVTCRVLRSVQVPSTLLEQMLAQLALLYADLEVLESSPDAIIGGRAAIRIKSRFTVHNTEGVAFRCLAHSYTLFASPLVFTVGISCAADGAFAVSEDLEAIAASIRVRR